MKSSTNMAWNLGSRMSGVELSQAALKREISSLRKDTSEIKFMMTEMCAAFHGQPSLAPSGGVTPTLALTDIQANIEGENANTTTTEEPPSLIKGSFIVPAYPDEHDKEEQIKKAKEEARLLAMTKPEVIKVVQEEAEKIGLDPKAIKGAKAGKMFKKSQDAKHTVLKRQHTEKVRKPLELRKHKLGIRYKWNHFKVGVSSDKWVGSLVVIFYSDASTVKSTENARFNMKLRKLIAEHLDQEKLQSKKVKLEALGYKKWTGLLILSYLQDAQPEYFKKGTLTFNEGWFLQCMKPEPKKKVMGSDSLKADKSKLLSPEVNLS
ncbi:hypothetical protein Tco_0259886 [Tanacetum coccineum]